MKTAAVCVLALLMLGGCLPPKLEIRNAGKVPISLGLDYHSRTIASGSASVVLYSGKDFTVTEGECLFRYAGLKRGAEPTLKLTWSGAGTLQAGSAPLAPISRRCAIEPEQR